MTVGRRGACRVGLVAPVLLLAACTSSGGPGAAGAQSVGSPTVPTTAGAPPAATDVRAAPTGLSAAVVQYRRDAQRDVLQVKVTNAGPDPVHVSHVRLDTWTFTGPVEAGKDSTIGAGLSSDLTLPLGEAACDGGGRSAEADHVTLEVDGRVVELAVEGDVLAGVREQRCQAQAVTEQVALEVSPGWTEAGEVRGEPALQGTITAVPQPGAAALTLVVEGATTLFTVAEPARVELPAGAVRPVGLDVVLTVTRCDPHAVAEDKKGYLLPVRVSVDGGEEVLVEVPVEVADRSPLQALIDRTCTP